MVDRITPPPVASVRRPGIKARRLDIATPAHKIGPDFQIDLLERYATANGAIPLYCLYNFAVSPDTDEAWRCCESFDETQLACTVTPLDNVRTAIAHRGCRTFEWLHRHPQTLPWRCLVKCRGAHRLFGPPSDHTAKLARHVFGREVRQYERLPIEVENAFGTGRVNQFSDQFYDPDVRLYPRRVVVLELAPSEEQELGVT